MTELKPLTKEQIEVCRKRLKNFSFTHATYDGHILLGGGECYVTSKVKLDKVMNAVSPIRMSQVVPLTKEEEKKYNRV